MSSEKTHKLSDEQAADLAALSQASQDAAATATVGDGDTAPPVGTDLAAEIAGLLSSFVLIAKPLLPGLGDVYTTETVAAVSEAVSRVCMKHGWLTDGLMGNWGEEIAAAAVLLPVGLATYQAVKKDVDFANEIKQKKQADLTQHFNLTRNLDGKNNVPGAKTVVVGAPIPEAPAA